MVVSEASVLAVAKLQAIEMLDDQLLSVLRRLVLADRFSEHHGPESHSHEPAMGLRRQTSRHLWPRAWELRCNLRDFVAKGLAIISTTYAWIQTDQVVDVTIYCPRHFSPADCLSG
jgi:hypothetical protein